MTETPATMGEGREEVREMVAGSNTEKEHTIECCYYEKVLSVPIVTVSAAVSVLGSVLEVATMVME